MTKGPTSVVFTCLDSFCLVLTPQHVHLVSDCPFTLALDEMGTRIDGLEKNVAELMTQAGMEEQAVSK